MNINVNKDSPQTQRYWRYVISQIVKPSPLHKGDIVRLTVKEDSPYWPEFSEKPLVLNYVKAIKRLTKSGKVRRDFVQVSPIEQETEQSWNEDRIREGIVEAVIWFTQRKLDNMCISRGIKASEDGKINIKFAFKIIDPIKIYQEAKRLEVKVLRGKNLSKYYTYFPSEWLENPPRIRWGLAEIEFTSAPLEQRICRIAYKQLAGVEINCYDIMEEIDPATVDNDKKNYNAVYNSIKRINKAVKNKTNKTLFRWTNRAFLRNA